MWQNVVVYAVVALAAVWTVWRVVLPAPARGALLRLVGRTPPPAAGGCGGCACGHGKSGCH